MSTLKPLEQFGSSIINPDNGAVLVRFDTNLEEGYSRSADVTAHPVEDGVPVTDNHQALQRQFSLIAEITNTPLAQETTVVNRAEFYFAVIDGLVDSGQRLTITSGFRVWENAVIKSYSVKRNAKTGQVLSVALKIIQIEVVSSATTKVPASILASVLKASGKSKDTKNPGKSKESTNQKKKRNDSILFSLFY